MEFQARCSHLAKDRKLFIRLEESVHIPAGTASQEGLVLLICGGEVPRGRAEGSGGRCFYPN